MDWSKGGFEKNPEVPQAQLYYAYFLGCNNQTEKSYAIFDKLIADGAGTIFVPLGMFLKYAFQGDKSRALDSLTFESKAKLKQDCEWSWLMADGYALIDEKDEALNWIESIVDSDFINYPLLSQHDPFLAIFVVTSDSEPSLKESKMLGRMLKSGATEGQYLQQLIIQRLVYRNFVVITETPRKRILLGIQ